MSLSRFYSAFAMTAYDAKGVCCATPTYRIDNFEFVVKELGGKTFNHGLYRVLRADQIGEAKQHVDLAFPESNGMWIPFGFDWLGRYFSVNLELVVNSQPQVLMVEIGAGDAFDIPCSILDFHNAQLVDDAESALAVSYWLDWRMHNPTDLEFTDCVGFKVPLFLGGVDDIPNLEVTDMSVYLHICAQLRRKTLNLPEGQVIRNIRISD